MGFMDKAKKMAEQAQAKLEEAQRQFNEGQSNRQSDTGPAVEYDAHGRPIVRAEPADTAPPQGDPLAEAGASTPPPTPAGSDNPLAPGAAGPSPGSTTDRSPSSAAPAPADDAPAEDRNRPSYAPPKLSSGDPLAG